MKPRIRVAHKAIFMGMIYFWRGYECFGGGECGWGDTPRAAYDTWIRGRYQAMNVRLPDQVVEQCTYPRDPTFWQRIKRAF